MGKFIINFVKFVSMEELIWIIVLIVIYVANFFLKRKEQEPVGGPPQEQTEQPYRPRREMPRSPFEELFGESETEEYEEKRFPESYDEEEKKPEYEILEQTDYQEYQEKAEREVQSAYEESVARAKKFKTLDEQVTIEDVSEIKAEKETRQAVPVSRYAALLRDPRTARDAVIMAEILNRKYE